MSRGFFRAQLAIALTANPAETFVVEIVELDHFSLPSIDHKTEDSGTSAF